eukprot:3194417-Amphidinium_carterae.1
MSLTLFTPRFPWKLRPYFPELERLGFPVRDFAQMHSVALEQQARSEVDVLVADEKRPTEENRDQPEMASKIRRRRATQEEKDAHQRK